MNGRKNCLFQRFTKNTFILEKNPTIVNFPVKWVQLSWKQTLTKSSTCSVWSNLWCCGNGWKTVPSCRSGEFIVGIHIETGVLTSESSCRRRTERSTNLRRTTWWRTSCTRVSQAQTKATTRCTSCTRWALKLWAFLMKHCVAKRNQRIMLWFSGQWKMVWASGPARRRHPAADDHVVGILHSGEAKLMVSISAVRCVPRIAESCVVEVLRFPTRNVQPWQSRNVLPLKFPMSLLLVVTSNQLRNFSAQSLWANPLLWRHILISELFSHHMQNDLIMLLLRFTKFEQKKKRFEWRAEEKRRRTEVDEVRDKTKNRRVRTLPKSVSTDTGRWEYNLETQRPRNGRVQGEKWKRKEKHRVNE